MRYKIADTETCGFDGPDETSSGVVEAAYLLLDEHAHIIGKGDSLISPGRPIGEEAMAVHGITEEMVAGKPTMAEFAAQHITKDPTVMVAHNLPFDLKFWGPHIEILSGTICTLAAARKYIKNTSNHKLATLADELNLVKGTAHRAAGDVVTTHQLLLFIMNLTNLTLAQLCEQQRKPTMLAKMPFGMHKGKVFIDIPVGYLSWIVSTADMPADVVFSAKQALNVKV